jgi:hypothetical protein
MKRCIILLAGLSLCACKRREITLDITWHLPGYVENTALFGEDIKAMEEKNAFILQTGKIDTTDEYPPEEIALISINKKVIKLQHIETITKEKEIVDAYSGGGYTLLLSNDKTANTKNEQYAKAHLTVSKGKIKSEYNVFRRKGYL